VLAACAALVGIVAICFAEVGSRFSASGGPYLIARTAYGGPIGFIVGWLYWISRVLTFATICNLFATYAARYLPAWDADATRVSVIVAVVGAIGIVHLLGIKHATIVGNALTAVKIAVLGGFGVFGLVALPDWQWPTGPAPTFDDTTSAMLLAVFAFVGFEASLVSAGETRNPRRDVPFAVAAALTIILLLYMGVQAVCLLVVPDLGTSATPLADAATTLWGSAGAHVIGIGAMFIMLGSLNSGFLATTRLPFAFAEQGDLPGVFARVHRRFRTPHVAILVSAVLVLASTLASSFLTAITLATSTRMIVYIAGCAALITLRKRPDVPAPEFVAPFGRAFAVAAIALSLALLANASGRELWQLAVAGMSGLVVYAAARSARS
jgi:amino acid transporter